MIVLGLSGSLRAGSYNSRLLDVAADLLPEGVSLRRYDGLRDIPPYEEDVEAHDAVVALREAIGAADAVLIATPEYNSSIPGHLKNALDWASRPFPDNSLKGKPVAVIGASVGLFGAVWAQAELRKVLGTIGAKVLDVELPVGQANEAFTDTGLVDEDLTKALADILTQLVESAR
ncbi:NADPH-dependent FMN reductase [Pseudonocardia spinosispora]|uniref:NADPH-dependent FMN reductase n=1 Tax=Pseudonocardia spinosispora TaxID=103441 RepID=UPI000429B648|nr:NAD(P)H-dependent oxidoreductase [Pseudonocardia spinosispora]